MTAATRTLILRALEQHRGDDFARWQLQMGRLTPQQRQAEWGESGRTPQQWYDEAEAHYVACTVAMEEVRQL